MPSLSLDPLLPFPGFFPRELRALLFEGGWEAISEPQPDQLERAVSSTEGESTLTYQPC